MALDNTQADLGLLLFTAISQYNTLLKEYETLTHELAQIREALVGLLQASIDASDDRAAMYAYIQGQPAHSTDYPEFQLPQHILDALRV